jgi:hypothetical protein
VKGLSAIGICLLATLPAVAQHPATGTLGPGSVGAVVDTFARSSPPNVHPAVARIVAPSNGSISYGSGTLVYANDQFGLVVTNWHVVNEATGPISVHFPDGFYSLGTVQQVDRDWDLAAIVVRKPNAKPVALADAAPRPGEVLTIAGYGSGNYRAASGQCTQYVAPGTHFPFEMVEVAVSARQGDSGGPIFNDKGELAGVLFGEGHGRTSGSYCGRVRWFLSSVVRELPDNSSVVAAGPLQRVPPRPSPSEADHQPRVVALSPTPFVETRAADGVARAALSAASSPATAAVGAGVRPAEPSPPAAQYFGWEDIAGKTLGEQAKTVLAVIGVLAMLLHVLRWMSTEPAKA